MDVGSFTPYFYNKVDNTRDFSRGMNRLFLKAGLTQLM